MLGRVGRCGKEVWWSEDVKPNADKLFTPCASAGRSKLPQGWRGRIAVGCVKVEPCRGASEKEAGSSRGPDYEF